MLSTICVLSFRMSFILSDMTDFSSVSCMEIVSLSVVWTYVILGIWCAPMNFIQSRLHLDIINIVVKILTNSKNLFGNPLHWVTFLLPKYIPSHIKIWRICSQVINSFPLTQVKVRSFVLVLRSDVLGVKVFLLAPTVSGDDSGVCFCAPLPPSPPRCLDIPWKHLTNFLKIQF